MKQDREQDERNPRPNCRASRQSRARGRPDRRRGPVRHRGPLRADWSGDDARWTVTIEHTETGARSERTCGFLYLCSGYYRYDEGYTPSWPGQEDFAGTLVHPQQWPAGLDVTGKRVTVIGSGATAVTMVPALAGSAAHVTRLQRSPSYVLSLPGSDPIAHLLRNA